MRRRRKTGRWIERILLLTGVVCLGIWIWSMASRVVYQDWESWAFDRQAHGEPATMGKYLAEKGTRLEERLRAGLKMPAKSAQPAPPAVLAPPAEEPPPIGKDGLVGRLTIPSLHLSTMVREGVGEETLRVAAGHIPGTAFPGQNGNVGVAAHRDTIFRGLRNIHKNDVIEFETLGAKHAYQVESTEIVSPRDTYVLKPGKQPELTLVTCYPFYYVGSAPDRFIVRARELSQPPMGQELSASAGQSSSGASPKTGVVDDPKPAAVSSAPSPSNRPARPAASIERHPGERKIPFAVSRDHSRELAPGISFGLTDTDATGRRLDGWMWLMPERRTIWVRDKGVFDPVVFYGGVNGTKRELVITAVTRTSVTGYLLLTD